MCYFGALLDWFEEFNNPISPNGQLWFQRYFLSSHRYKMYIFCHMIAVCPDDCSACSYTDDELTCTSCISEFVLNPADCASCPKNCMECSVLGLGLQCDVCEAGYVLMDDYTCQGTVYTKNPLGDHKNDELEFVSWYHTRAVLKYGLF